MEATIPDSDHLPSTIFPMIMGISSLIIAAGADTTATTLSSAMFFLTKYPHYRARLRKEIEEVSTGTNSIELSQIASLPFLNAVM